MQETKEETKLIEPKLINQVIGQPKAVEAVKRAASAHRNLLFIGLPGTGKSMLGKSLSEMLGSRDLFDVISKHNADDASKPKIEMVPAGDGETQLKEEAILITKMIQQYNYFTLLGLLVILATAMTFILINTSLVLIDVLFSMLLAITWIMYRQRSASSKLRQRSALIISNKPDVVPFVDASGSSYNILLGDVKHDPYQSGGLETPPHHLLVPGLVHKAHGGVLYIDEIGTLDAETQFHLLTALQDRTFPIEGRGENSSGSVVKTNPIPCNFTLVAAGNIETLELLHPALRSRIQGFGMEVLMESHLRIASPKDIDSMFRQLIQQELSDHSIEFDESSIKGLGQIAEQMGKRDGYMTLQFRELGGIIRSAFDQASFNKQNQISYADVIDAYQKQIPIEHQLELQSQRSRINESAMYWDSSCCWNQNSENSQSTYHLIRSSTHSSDNPELDVLKQITQEISKRENIEEDIPFSISSSRDISSNSGNTIPASVIALFVAKLYNLKLPQNFLIIGSVDHNLKPQPIFNLAFNLIHAKQCGFVSIYCMVREDYRVFKNEEKDVTIVKSYEELVNLLKANFGG